MPHPDGDGEHTNFQAAPGAAEGYKLLPQRGFALPSVSAVAAHAGADAAVDMRSAMAAIESVAGIAEANIVRATGIIYAHSSQPLDRGYELQARGALAAWHGMRGLVEKLRPLAGTMTTDDVDMLVQVLEDVRRDMVLPTSRVARLVAWAQARAGAVTPEAARSIDSVMVVVEAQQMRLVDLALHVATNAFANRQLDNARMQQIEHLGAAMEYLNERCHALVELGRGVTAEHEQRIALAAADAEQSGEPVRLQRTLDEVLVESLAGS